MAGDNRVLERFIKLAGGLDDRDLDCADNRMRLGFCIKSRWFDATGEKDDEFTRKVADEYWRIIQETEEMRFAHTDLTAVKKNIERIQSKFAGK